MSNSKSAITLIVRIATVFLLATAQLPALARDDAPASVVQELVPFFF